MSGKNWVDEVAAKSEGRSGKEEAGSRLVFPTPHRPAPGAAILGMPEPKRIPVISRKEREELNALPVTCTVTDRGLDDNGRHQFLITAESFNVTDADLKPLTLTLKPAHGQSLLKHLDISKTGKASTKFAFNAIGEMTVATTDQKLIGALKNNDGKTLDIPDYIQGLAPVVQRD